MHPERSRGRFERRLAVAALLLVGGITSIALAGLVPGKGSAKTACYVEYDVQGITNPGAPVTNNGGTVLCTDGEPCDIGTGHKCGDAMCVLRVRVCINQKDPNTPSCTPPAGLQRLVVNPKKINGINTSMCGAAAAENTGYVEVPLIQDLVPKCKAEGKAEPTIQLYDNNANCIQAILAGRADTYVNDVNTVDQAVKANPDKLEKAIAVTIPYSVGIAVPKDKPKFREAVMAALTEIYKSGDQLALLKKWELDPNNLKEPGLLTVK